MIRARQQGSDASLAGHVALNGEAPASSRSATSEFVDAEDYLIDSEKAGTGVRYSRRLHSDILIPFVGVLVAVVGLLLLLLAGLIFCRWRKRSKLMKKTVKDFSSDADDVEAQTPIQVISTRRPSLAGVPPPPPAPAPPVEKAKPRHILDTAPPSKERLGTCHIPAAAPPSPHSTLSERPKMERSRGSTLLLAAGNPNPPREAAPSPPTSKSNPNPATKAKLTLPIKTKQNRVEDGTMSPMTAMSTEAPSSFRGVPPTKWEHIKVETVRTVRKDARCSSPSGKAPRVGGEDEAPAAHKLLRKSSSFG